MPNPSKRMTAQPSRPVARYRPGKPVAQEESSDEEDSEEEQQQQKPQRKPAPRPAPKAKAQQEEEEDDDEEGFVTDPEDDEDGGVEIPSAKPTATKQEPKTKARISSELIVNEDEVESEEESEEESDSESSAESSSSEDEPKRKFQRPTFIKKSDRRLSASADAISSGLATSEAPEDEDTQARRVAHTENLIADRIRRDALARAAGRKGWDDDDDFAPEELVDDTDGLDPEAEHQAWRLRELQRLKRDREAMIAREKEIEELERRRNLTAAEREKEDSDFISKQKEERDDGRGQSGFLARYHHKGAFFQDDEAAEILKRRDVMGAKFADEVTDKSALPEYMRIRDMNKLGKKGRTRYKDLRNEDTGKWGDEVKRWRGAGDNRGRDGGDGMDTRGLDERFLPDQDRGGPTASGANASAVGERRQRQRSRSRSPRRKDDGGDNYRPRRRSYSRSRSQSPGRRKRSPSPPSRRRAEEDDDRAKRRRVVDAV